jgi:hypothetical protein
VHQRRQQQPGASQCACRAAMHSAGVSKFVIQLVIKNMIRSGRQRKTSAPKSETRGRRRGARPSPPPERPNLSFRPSEDARVAINQSSITHSLNSRNHLARPDCANRRRSHQISRRFATGPPEPILSHYRPFANQSSLQSLEQKNS